MNQRLHISNFGCIKEVTIDVQDFLVFIGSQASGKSTISKAIFFFKSLRDDLIGYLYKSYEQKQFNELVNDFAKLSKQKFLKIYGSVVQFPEMHLIFEYGNGVRVEVQQNNLYTDITFNKKFGSGFRALVQQIERVSGETRPSGFLSSRELSTIKAKEASLFEDIGTQVNKLFNDDDDRDLLFLPAGRSLITILSQQRHNIEMDEWEKSDPNSESDSLTKLDYLMQNFIARIDNTRGLFHRGFSSFVQERLNDNDKELNPKVKYAINLAQSLINSILKGSYRYENGVDRIDFGNGSNALINFVSSGQQEVVWILLLIVLLIIEQRNFFLVVEEPEAHLFPIAQKEIVDLLALLFNQGNSQIIITTHSPYILSALNNNLYAHTLGSKKPEAVDAVIDRQLWIDSGQVNAFMLEEGYARSIMDTDLHLIQSAEIDKASDVIVDTFNRLFELED